MFYVYIAVLVLGVVAGWTYWAYWMLVRPDWKSKEKRWIDLVKIQSTTLAIIVLGLVPLTYDIYRVQAINARANVVVERFTVEYENSQLVSINELSDVWIVNYTDSNGQMANSINIGEEWLTISAVPAEQAAVVPQEILETTAPLPVSP